MFGSVAQVVASYAGVFSVVTQCSSPQMRDDTENARVGGYSGSVSRRVLFEKKIGQNNRKNE